MFETLPVWSAPIANFTGWFDWEALSALFTAGALWFALRQAGKAERIELQRMIAVIGSYWTIVDGYARALAALERRVRRRPNLSAADFLHSGVTEHVLAALEEYNFRDFPTGKLMSEQVVVKMTIRDIEKTIRSDIGEGTLADELKAARETLEVSIETVKTEVRITFSTGLKRVWLRAKQRSDNRRKLAAAAKIQGVQPI